MCPNRCAVRSGQDTFSPLPTTRVLCVTLAATVCCHPGAGTPNRTFTESAVLYFGIPHVICTKAAWYGAMLSSLRRTGCNFATAGWCAVAFTLLLWLYCLLLIYHTYSIYCRLKVLPYLPSLSYLSPGHVCCTLPCRLCFQLQQDLDSRHVRGPQVRPGHQDVRGEKLYPDTLKEQRSNSITEVQSI